MRLLLLLVFSQLFIFVNSDRLHYAISLFRHGQRAPNPGLEDPPLNETVFQYGVSELTEKGIQQSFELGRFLRKRYVNDNKLLRPLLDPKEIFVSSVAVERCLMSAEAVGQGLFSLPTRGEVPLPIAVHSTFPREDDWALGFTWHKCPALGKLIKKSCPDQPDVTSTRSYPKFEEINFRCTGAGENATFFGNVSRFHMIERLIAEELAGAKMPFWYTAEAAKEGRYVYYKTLRHQLGIGEYHNPAMLRLAVGLLTDTVLKQMVLKWECITTPTAPECKVVHKQKFRAFSTQDFILNMFMEVFGFREAALGSVDESPEYNSLVLFELWESDNGTPIVKTFYRRRPDEQLLEVTRSVRGCLDKLCALEVWRRCCPQYRTQAPKEECMAEVA